MAEAKFVRTKVTNYIGCGDASMEPILLFLLVCALLYSPHTAGSLESQSKPTLNRFMQVLWPMRKTTYIILFGASLAVIECMRQPLNPRHSAKYLSLFVDNVGRGHASPLGRMTGDATR